MEVKSVDFLGYRRNTKIFTCYYPKFKCNVAVIRKQNNSIFRDGMSYNEAAANDCMCWFIDESYLAVLIGNDVKWLIFYEEEVEDVYLSHISDWQDEEKRYIKQNPNPNTFSMRYNSADMHYMSFKWMQISPGRPSMIK